MPQYHTTTLTLLHYYTTPLTTKLYELQQQVLNSCIPEPLCTTTILLYYFTLIFIYNTTPWQVLNSCIPEPLRTLVAFANVILSIAEFGEMLGTGGNPDFAGSAFAPGEGGSESGSGVGGGTGGGGGAAGGAAAG